MSMSNRAPLKAAFSAAVILLLCSSWIEAEEAAAKMHADSTTEQTGVCLGADWGCHFWTNADGSRETFYYEVVRGKYEFAHDKDGQLILLGHEHSPPLQTTDDGLYQCLAQTHPSLCMPREQEAHKLPIQFGSDHRHTIHRNYGREDFWILPGHQSLTEISDPAVWARSKDTVPQYKPLEEVTRNVSLQSMLSEPTVNTGVCLGADWGCHFWVNPDGSRENFNYKVIPGKYEFAHDKDGLLILLSHEHAPPLQVTDDGLYQCRVQTRPTLCSHAGRKPWQSVQFGPEHKRTINNSHGREDFWTLPGRQSLTDVVDPKQWAEMQSKAPQYSGY